MTKDTPENLTPCPYCCTPMRNGVCPDPNCAKHWPEPTKPSSNLVDRLREALRTRTWVNLPEDIAEAADEIERMQAVLKGLPKARKCMARATTDPPQDCDAPFCGCDPAWSACIEMLQECNLLRDPRSPVELPQLSNQIDPRIAEARARLFSWRNGQWTRQYAMEQFEKLIQGFIDDSERTCTVETEPLYRKWPGEPPHCMSCSCGMTQEQQRTVPLDDYLRIHRELIDLKYPGTVYDPNKCFVCGGNHGNLPCPKMVVTCTENGRPPQP